MLIGWRVLVDALDKFLALAAHALQAELVDDGCDSALLDVRYFCDFAHAVAEQPEILDSPVALDFLIRRQVDVTLGFGDHDRN